MFKQVDCHELVIELSFTACGQINITITERQVTICHKASSGNCKIPVERPTVTLTCTEQIYA